MIPDAVRIEHVLNAIRRIKSFVVGMDRGAFLAKRRLISMPRPSRPMRATDGSGTATQEFFV